MHVSRCFSNPIARLFALVFLLARLTRVQAQPVLISSSPADGATGVSVSSPVIFTFSEAMDPNGTISYCLTGGSTLLPTLATWNESNTIMTNTPNPAFPANATIQWVVDGQSAGGVSIGGVPTGSFTTGSGSGGAGGSGTNAVTVFAVAKSYLYDQTSSAAPVPVNIDPYSFLGETTLASNRTASAITLTLPNNSVSNLIQNLLESYAYFLFTGYTNPATLDSAWPDDSYTFTVYSNSSIQTVSVTLPSTLAQPDAPQISNFDAAQNVNASQAFTLTWGAFQGGTTSDYIYVTIGTNLVTQSPGVPGALNGTVTALVIPANTLQPNSSYSCDLGFYHAVINTNNATYSTLAYKASSTEFTVLTGSGAVSGPLTLANPTYAAGIFSFNVLSTAGQSFSVESATSLAGPWQLLVATNSPTGILRIADPHSANNSTLFYRAY